MSKSADDMTETLLAASRRTAERQATSVGEYRDALKSYSSGDLSYADFSKVVLRLGAKEYGKATEEFYQLGADAYSWLLSLTGIKAFTATGQSAAEAKRDPAQPSAKVPLGKP